MRYQEKLLAKSLVAERDGVVLMGIDNLPKLWIEELKYTGKATRLIQF